MPDSVLKIRPGSTEPLEVRVGARGLEDLSELQGATLTLTRGGEPYVTAAGLSVADEAGRILAFDPVEALGPGEHALQEEGTYRGYVTLTWSDSDVTHHPDDGDLVIVVRS